MKIKLKIDPDYHTWGIWGLDLEDMEGREDPPYYWNDIIDPDKLPISQATVQRVNAWAETYDSSFLDSEGNEDFSEPSLWSKEQWQSFWQEGFDLWIQLQQELGKEYEVFYNMYIPLEKKQRLLKSPDELKALQIN